MFFLKVVDSQRQEEKTQAAADMKSRLGQNVAQSRFTATKSRHLPTAEEAKRIAKIFSSKASWISKKHQTYVTLCMNGKILIQQTKILSLQELSN